MLRGSKRHLKVCQHLNSCKLDHVTRRMAGAAESLLNSLPNYEMSGVPPNAGKDGDAGFKLDQMHQLLADMHEPNKQLKVVHIAGTKGKGSTAAMLSSILHSSGLRVGTYTSPHITAINERIAIDLEQIGTAALDSLAERWRPVIERANKRNAAALTHFEVLTALGIAHFAEQQVDVAVVEAGLGGIRDATNVFTSQELLLAIVTALGLEHQAALGSTLEEIAAAKAGICKKDRPLLIGHQTAEATDLLRNEAGKIGSPCIEAAQISHVQSGQILLHGTHATQDFLVRICEPGLSQPSGEQFAAFLTAVKSRLMGDHQAGNAATAVAATVQLESMGILKASPSCIKTGLEACTLAGRFEVSKWGRDKPWLVFDGAHTPGSAAALVHTLGQAFKGLPLSLIVAMANDKDHGGFLAALRGARPHVITFTGVPIAGSSERSAPPGMLVGHWQVASLDENKPLRCRELMLTNMAAAMEASLREMGFASGEAVICITGSLHAVSAAKQIVSQNTLQL